MTNTCFDPELQSQWQVHIPSVFDIEVVDELEEKSGQTDKEYKDDLKDLLTILNEAEN